MLLVLPLLLLIVLLSSLTLSHTTRGHGQSTCNVISFFFSSFISFLFFTSCTRARRRSRNTVYLVLAAGVFGCTHSVALLLLGLDGSLIQTAIRKNYFRTRRHYQALCKLCVWIDVDGCARRLHFVHFTFLFTLCGGLPTPMPSPPPPLQ